jgi:chorismate mutase
MTIEDWRAEIDKIDGELLRLLNRRAELAVRVGESKRRAGRAVEDRVREREVLERARENNRGPLDGDALARLFRAIIRESRRLQMLADESQGEAAREAAQ